MAPRIEAYAIISADGMIANAAGIHPDELKNEADLRFFHDGLDRAGLVVHGRDSHEGGASTDARRRLILTRSVRAAQSDPHRRNVFLWNPAGAAFEQAWQVAGAAPFVAVIGGTEVFGLFLEIGYDAFHLTRSAHVQLPGGRPVFPVVPDKRPEEILAAHGLRPGATQILDAAAGVTLVSWQK